MTSPIPAEIAGFKEMKFVSSLVCNIRMKNAFLIPDPLIHNPLICNPQSPQGKKRKSTSALEYLSTTSGQVLQRTSGTEPSSWYKIHLSQPAAILGGLRDNQDQTALVRVSEHWMFGEVLGMMSQELSQLPTDLQDQLISSRTTCQDN